MTNTHSPSRRLYDLDALRAFAMFLGIVLHTGSFLYPDPSRFWPVHDPAIGDDFTYWQINRAIHGFRMPVFFLLSGFFSAMLWQRRGLQALFVHRWRRVGVPFGLACVTILPLSTWLSAVAADFQEPFDFPMWQLPLVWIANLAHLWFLWYLLVLVGIFILVARLGTQFLHPAWWLTIPFSMAVSLLMVDPSYGPDTSTKPLPEPVIVAFYGCFFLFGVFFYQRGYKVRRWWTVALLPSMVAFYAGTHLLEQYVVNLEGAGHFGQTAEGLEEGIADAFMFQDPLTLGGTLVASAYAWLMCFGLMGLFRWMVPRENFTVQYLSDASYWTYLAHVPLVIAGQMLVVNWPVHYHVKFLMVCVAATLILLATYQFGVRYTIIGRILNGPRQRRQPSSTAQPG